MKRLHNLKIRALVDLSYKKPFSFEKTFYHPSHFYTGLEYYDKKSYYMSLRYEKKIIGLKFYMNKYKLICEIYSTTKISSIFKENIINEISQRFSLKKDYNIFYHKYSTDKFLKNSIKRNYGRHISTMYSLYESLIISTFLQNTTVQRSIKMCKNMMENYGERIKYDGVILNCFWDIDDFYPEESELRALKLGYRAKNIMRITEFFKNNNINDEELRKLETNLLVKNLLKIYGVGKQTIFYILLGQFHVTSYLKHIPLWERKILSYFIFKKALIEEDELVTWFNIKYESWAGFSLSLVMEDIFHQHKRKPLGWLKKILGEE